MSVAAEPMFAAHASASRNGSGCESFLAAHIDENRRDREANDVVAEHRREAGHSENQRSQQHRRRQTEAADLDCYPGVEAAEPQLRRDDHEREQQDDGRQMDRMRRLVERELTDRQQRDRTQQCDPGSVQRQKRQRAQDHSEVDDAEDRDDGKVHGLDEGCRR